MRATNAFRVFSRPPSSGERPKLYSKPSALRQGSTEHKPINDGFALLSRIVAEELPNNPRRVKDLAFIANRMAKITAGSTQSAWYKIKDEAINGLIQWHAAVINSLDISMGQIGVTFVAGGRLHTKVTGLDSAALRIVRRHLLAALEGRLGFYRFSEARSRMDAAAL